MSVYFNITEIELGYLELIEMTEVEAHMASYSNPCLLQIINGRLPTGSTNFDHDGLSGRFRTVRAMPYGPQKFKSCHDFSVELSLCICSHTDSSCPDCWHTYAIPDYLW